MGVTDKILDIYLRILRISRFEQEMGKRFAQGQLPGLVHLVDGADAEAVARARLGKGRTLIEAKTHRRGGHAEGEEACLAGQRYRSHKEQEAARQQDPLLRLHGYITERNLLAPETVETLDQQTTQAVADAVTFARNSPDPDAKVLYEDTWV